jgi:hypothetical protein
MSAAFFVTGTDTRIFAEESAQPAMQGGLL